MRRVALMVSAGSAAVSALAKKAVDTAGEIRDMAEVGPWSIDRILEPSEIQSMQREAQGPVPTCNESLALRIRSILGPRNDDSRAVTDLVDDLCEEVSGQMPSCDTCGCELDYMPWHYSKGSDRHLHACDRCWPEVKETI